VTTTLRPLEDSDTAGLPSTGIIDCDTHNERNSHRDLYPYLSKAWREQIDQFGFYGYSGSDYPRFAKFREDAYPENGGNPGTDSRFFAADHLDRHNIKYCMLIPLRKGARSANPDLDAAIAAATNDWQVEHWLDVDPRYRSSIDIASENPHAAAKEIERRAKDKRFVQVVFVGRPGEPLGRRKYWPIFEACANNDLKIMTHAFGASGNPLSACGWPSYYIEDHIGVSQSIQANITSLILEGVFDAFPDLKLVSVENTFGWYSSLMWRLDRTAELLRGELRHLGDRPSEIMQRHVYVASQPMLEPPKAQYLADLFEQVPALADRLLFSSDYPHWDSDNPSRAIPRRMPGEMREKIYYRNALELYGLEDD
jgi:predicted TIM-barrel fold metal-dependent hydrolase